MSTINLTVLVALAGWLLVMGLIGVLLRRSIMGLVLLIVMLHAAANLLWAAGSRFVWTLEGQGGALCSLLVLGMYFFAGILIIRKCVKRYDSTDSHDASELRH